ncbi:MAG: DUF692 domain-containing protein [Deltaproteobacteria bacterium]|nr:DUF692 domain-containing protein [Deltaproteobacteria bacterium]
MPSKSSHTDVPFLGFGLGLRTPHYSEIEEGPVGVDWFEAISENFMRPGGNPRRVLRAIRERFPVVLHGVSLSIGAVDPLNEEYLNTLAALVKDVEPTLVSDHLCWSGNQGLYAHDLLPLPYTEEALEHVAKRILQVQDKLKRRLVIENVSSYMAFAQSTMTEWEFLTEVCRKADCLLLLDVNNIFVSAHNHKFDGLAFINGVPADRVAQIHVAGHRKRGELLLDTHDHAVPEGVWALYEAAIRRCGPVSTLVEWDAEIPPLADVIAQADRARSIALRVHGPLQVPHGERHTVAPARKGAQRG